MDQSQKQQMFASTPLWLWPVLWFSIRAYEKWLYAYWAEHGYCVVCCKLSGFATLHVVKIYPPEDNTCSSAYDYLSAFHLRQFIHAMRSDVLISQPLRRAVPGPNLAPSLGLTDDVIPSFVAFVQFESIRDGPVF